MAFARLASVALALVAGATLCSGSTYPQAVHLALTGDPSEMLVQYSSGTECPEDTAVVTYAPSASFPAHLQHVFANSTQWTYGNADGNQFAHRAVMKGLVAGLTYTYRVRCGETVSENFEFTAMRTDAGWNPKMLVYGDMGRDQGAPTISLLQQRVKSGDYAGIIHVGDFAYDLQDFGGVRGDEFMDRIEPFAASVPYMVCIGNHEDNFNYSNYINRFTMPGDSHNMWYSWDYGLFHFIAYSSEVYFRDFPSPYTPEAQLAWIKEDLAKANAPDARAKHPWIVAYGHRPMYCSNLDHDDCSTPASVVRAGLEETFMTGGVDLIIEAHEHSYERMYPVWNETVTAKDYVNPAAPVHVVSGAAGCNEADGFCLNPMFGPKGDWSAFRFWTLGYGFMEMEAPNATHLHWSQIWDITDEPIDEVWITQNHHGPRTI